EALKERNTIQELAAKYEVHAQQITDWKLQFMDCSEAAFERPGSGNSKVEEKDKLIGQLYAQIGQLKVENDFLKKN
ncbi:MAG: IS3 family transposase, partial [Bacteroidetes bacterium]|nr:IS3 family transposase [Bacteroidota bacterium]